MMASESELSVEQVKQRKTLKSWFKPLPKRKKKKSGEERSLDLEAEDDHPKSSRNILQRMKMHFVKRFSKTSTVKIQVNELYESAEVTPQEPKNNESGNFTEFYKMHLQKKWLKIPEPNQLMYKTSLEMLR